MPNPLQHLRVLDLSQNLAAPFAAKLLADQGADTIKLEPPQGDTARHHTDNPETSPTFLYANTSKRSIIIDPQNPQHLQLRQTLLDRADIIFADQPQPTLAQHNLHYQHIAQTNPQAILVTLTGFGSHGPYTHWRWNHLTACALGGFAHLCGRPHRQPLQLGARITETLAGAYAAVAALIALRGRHLTGHGDHVDVSALEAAVNMALLVVQRYEYTGQISQRRAHIGPSPSFILPTADGHIGANTLTQPQWEMMCQFFQRPDLIQHPHFADAPTRMDNAEHLAEQLAPITRQRNAEDIFHDAQTWRIPFGLIPNLQQVLDLLPHRERHFFQHLQHPIAGPLQMPGIPWRFDNERPTATRPPLLDEHADQIRTNPWPQRQPQPTNHPTAPDAKRPLEGLRIIDLSMFMSGPMTTLICADAGAHVLKIESVQRIDGWRLGAAIGVDGQHFWEMAPQFNWVNRNKHGITLNLTDPRGADIVRHLVQDADIIVENYTPRVMNNFGLDWPTLRQLNPNLIMLSMPGFGLSGSWAHYTAFANTTEQLSGLPHLTGYPDDQPIFSGTTGGDPLAGVMGALALLTALERRDQLTAQNLPGGTHIDLSQTETATAFLGDALTDFALSQHDPGRTANHHPRHAPHNTYQCADNRWIALACETDHDFAQLAQLLQQPHWTAPDGPYRTFPQRNTQREQLDTDIAQLLRHRDPDHLMRQLQAHNIPAGVVYTGKDLLQDPHLHQRGFFITQHHTHAGDKRYPLQPYRFARWLPPETHRPSPTLGQHNRDILASLTPLTPHDIDALQADDIIGQIPLAARND